MVDTLTGKSPDKLQELFSSYQELVKRQQGLAERLQKAEREKESVDERIYEKVISGYMTDLENIKADLAPVQNEITELKLVAQKELDDLEPKIKVLGDELAELGFRYRVGEFHDVDYEDKKKLVDGRMEELSKQKNEILQKIEAFDLDKETAKHVEETNQPQNPSYAPETAEAPEISGRPDETRDERTAPTDSVASDAGSAFENPNDWLGDLGGNKNTGQNPVPDEPISGGKDPFMDDDDPLSALADPSDENSRRASDKTGNPAGYPNLVINSGPNAGKKIPLLPMTMSVGREHDNNIELKDPEVARYHARVLYERGEFVLEDLESSTGTWLNGLTVKKTPLKNGDKLRFGSTELSIEFN